MAYSPDGKTLASACDDGTVILWDAATGKPRGEPLAGHKGAVYAVAFSPDGKTLASAGARRDRDRSGTPPPASAWASRSRGTQDAVSAVAFSPDGKTLASASRTRP